MTQMFLFDSITDHSPVVAPAVIPVSATPAGKPEVHAREALAREALAHEEQSHQPGLNHMGDLARLVLLRYDLVAARRARRAAK